MAPRKIPSIIIGIAFILVFVVFLQRGLGTRSRETLLPESIFFIKDGEPNKNFIKNVSFFGDVKRRLAEDGMFTMVNSRGVGWANFAIAFKEPVDMKRFYISYNARGETGDEYLLVILVDKENRTYGIKRYPMFPITKEWQEYFINPEIAKSAVNLNVISEIRFEFGGLTAGNYPDATIFLKDLYLAKKEV